MCALSEADPEPHQHLFFKCFTSAMHMLHWFGIKRGYMEWNEEIEWARVQDNGRNSLAEIYRLSLALTTYHVWRKRNYKIFQ